MNQSKPIRLIYLAGYGRSGSTVLGAILASHSEIQGLGELGTLFGGITKLAIHDIHNCSCGKPFEECEFWTKILNDAGYPDLESWKKAFAVVKKTDEIQSLWALVNGAFEANGKYASTGQEYAHIHNSILEKIQGATGRNIMVDTSKSIYVRMGRFYALHRLVNVDMRVIHLVRDGRATMWARTKGRNIDLRQGEQAISIRRGVVGAALWAFTNMMTSLLLRKLPKENRLRVNYSDLVEHPVETLMRIGEFIGVDMRPLAERIHNGQEVDLLSLHIAGGNRLLHQQRFVLKSDDSWRTKLPKISQVLYYLFFFPFHFLYRD